MKHIFKRVFSVILSICMIMSVTSVVLASDTMYVKMKENNVATGRVFKSDEAPGFTVVLQNKGTAGVAAVTGTLKNITLNNSIVWTTTKNISIDAKEQITVDFLPVYNSANGFGNLVFSVSVVLNNETYTIETEEFTRINGADSVVSNLGFNTNMNLSTKWRNAGIQDHINVLNAGGFGMIRECKEWAAIEVGNTGTYRLDDEYLEYLNSIKSRGGRIIFVLGYNNVNYGMSKSTIIPTEENGTLQPFLNYCEWIVKKLDGIVDDFEVWNEPDIAWFSQTQSAQEYYDLLKAVYPVIKNARENKSANVVGMVTTSGVGSRLVSKDGPVYPNNAGGKTFMYHVVQLGGLEYMDKVSFHHYPDNAFDISSNYNVNEIFDMVLDELGTYNKPLIISEIGYTTKNQTEDQKASYMPKFLPLIKSIPSRSGWSDVNIDGICFYQLFDKKASSDSDKNDPEFYFGSLRADMTAKADFITTSFANKMIGTASSVSLVNENKRGINKYSFVTADGDTGYVLWNYSSYTTNHTVSFTQQSGYKAKVYDMYGNLESVTDSNSVTVKPGADVKYIIYSNKSDADVTATAPQKPSSYIYPESIVENCEISVNNGTVTINGNANSEYVSIFATEFEKDIKESDVVEIVKVDNNSFSKTISLPSGKIYRISVSAGYIKENVFTSEMADGKIVLKVNGENITSAENLNSYGSIVANVSLDRTTMKNPMLIGAVYTGEELEACDIGENGSLAVEIISDENETAGIMLWEQDTLTPVFPKIEIKKQE